MTTIALITAFIFSNAFGADKCTYQFDEENSVVEGTGYKYTEKVGVTGKFPGFKLNKNEKANSVKELLSGLQVTVDLVTLDSGNSLRDKNMRETLFSGILGDSVAVVSVDEVTDKQIKTTIKLNEKTQKVTFDYKKKEGRIEAEGVFDAMEYALGDQIAALKKRCGSLHTGSDGKSVTWTDFKLKVSAALTKNCK